MKNLIAFFFEAGSLRKIPRSHRQTLLTEDPTDNIASHSYRVALIGYLLAKQAGADTGKVAVMCLLHDLGETRSGDQNWVHKRYVKVFEEEIIRDQLDGITEDNEPLKLAQEYHKRQSLEAKIAKDADIIDQALILKEHIQSGNQEAANWIGDHKLDFLHLDISKDLYRQIVKSSPTDWWQDIWTSDRR